MAPTILIVDDEPSQLRMAEYAVGQKLGYRAVTASGGEEAVRWITGNQLPQPDLMLLDLVMPGMGGMEVIRAVKAARPQLPVIVFTQYGDDERATQAVLAGASDFLAKPVVLERLKLSISNALKIKCLRDRIACLERNIAGHVDFSAVIGRSAIMQQVLEQGIRAAQGDGPVWIDGGRGTGKELLARAIHGGSSRAGKAFVVVDCRALAGDGEESVLQHEQMPGQKSAALLRGLREAGDGTVFFREIGALSPELQHCLLEALEENSKPVHEKPRIICSASRDIGQAVAEGKFSHLLSNRLNAATIMLPSLQERPEDIALLAEHFVALYAAAENKYIHGLEKEALHSLAAAIWPGNVRQLAQLLWRAVMICDGEKLDAEDVKLVSKSQASSPAGSLADGYQGAMPLLFDRQGKIKKLKSIEDEVIRFALRHSNGCMTRAARSLGIGRSTLYRRINELSLDAAHYISRPNQATRPMIKLSSIDRS